MLRCKSYEKNIAIGKGLYYHSIDCCEYKGIIDFLYWQLDSRNMSETRLYILLKLVQFTSTKW